MRKKKSKCWQYFSQTPSGAKCLECDAVVSTSKGNTSNLFYHLRSKHSIELKPHKAITSKFIGLFMIIVSYFFFYLILRDLLESAVSIQSILSDLSFFDPKLSLIKYDRFYRILV